MFNRRNYLDMIILLVLITVFTTNLPNCEGNPYPFLNLVSRVSRGPSIRSNEDELDGSSQMSLSAASRLAFLKSPAFHMRFRPNRYAHLHQPPNNNYPLSLSSVSSSPLFKMNGQMSGEEPSSEMLLNNGDDSQSYDASGLASAASMLGHLKAGESGTSSGSGSGSDGNAVDGLATEEPTFTPFISASALSNMEKFFQHLRENLVAIQQDGTDDGEGAGDGNGDASESSEVGPPERRRIVHAGATDDYPQGSSISRSDGGNGNAEYQSDDVANHDYSYKSSPDEKAARALDMALRWQPPASGQFRGAIPSPLYSSSSSSSSSKGTGSGSRLHKMQTFIQPLTDEELYLRKANNYNPSWLWTNMGLGRKRRR